MKITKKGEKTMIVVNVLTAKDLMETLKVSKTTAYALMANQGFPSYKLNGRYYVTEEELHNWLRSIKGKTFYT